MTISAKTGLIALAGVVAFGATLIAVNMTRAPNSWFCPDFCALDSARNAEASRLLATQGKDVQTAFISIDPERDTAEAVGVYTDLFDENMIGLTGTLEQVSAASKAYRTYFKKHDDDPEYYLVDHSTFTYFVMPDVGFVEFFRSETSSEDMAAQVACFIDAEI